MSQSKAESNSNLRWLVVFIAIAILVLLVARCVPTPTPEIGEEQTPGEYYMENQIMLTGDPNDIQTIVNAFDEIDGSEGPIDELEPFEFIIPSDYDDENPPPRVIQRLDPGVEIPEFPDLQNQFPELPTIDSGIGKVAQRPVSQPSTTANISFQLYPTALGSGRTELDLAAEVNVFALVNQLNAIAEPNYLTNLPIGGSGGDGGSGIVGDPTGGSPVEAGRAKFTTQWAFTGVNGIGLPEGLDRSGLGVQIAVFDTSPLEAGDQTIGWAKEQYTLHVVKPGLRFGDSGSTSSPDTEDDPVSQGEHGLFVAGLAQYIAKEAEIYLIEVLDVNAQGDVFTLIKAMATFLNDHAITPDSSTRTVFNLSLGIEAVRDEVLEDEEILARLEKIVQNIEIAGSAPSSIDKFPVAALEIAIGIAEQRGVVVIAAAGNDGFQDVSQPPASFDEVVGVASSNFDADASCFSNPGDLAGPSGDGMPICVADIAVACGPDPAICDTIAVVSTVTQKDNSNSGYAYWTGTSFSTPMVSGLAALLLNEDSTLTLQQLRSEIMNCTSNPTGDAKLGAGIINVEACLTTP